MSEPLYTSEEGAAALPPRVDAVSERAVHSAPADVETPIGQGRSSGCLPLVLAAVVAAIIATVVSAAVSTAVLFLGSHSDGTLGGGGSGRTTQMGDVSTGKGAKLEVYYATPYEGNPNLTLKANGQDDWNSAIVLEEQKPDHFTIKSRRFDFDASSDKIHWIAVGSLKK